GGKYESFHGVVLVGLETRFRRSGADCDCASYVLISSMRICVAGPSGLSGLVYREKNGRRVLPWIKGSGTSRPSASSRMIMCRGSQAKPSPLLTKATEVARLPTVQRCSAPSQPASRG